MSRPRTQSVSTPVPAATLAQIEADRVISEAQLYAAAVARQNHSGQESILVKSISTDYTVEAVYLLNKSIIVVDSPNPVTVTIPSHASVPAPVGAELYVLKIGAGNVTVAGAVGVTPLSAASLTSSTLNTRFSCLKIGQNLWHIEVPTLGTSTGTPPTGNTGPSITAQPTISYSSTDFGAVMTCDPGAASGGATSSFQWRFFDPELNQGGAMIPAQTSSTYTTSRQDVGSRMICRVTWSNNFGQPVFADALGPIITDPTGGGTQPPPSSVSRGPRITVFESSGPITASDNQVISGKAFSGAGIKIIIPFGVSNVLIEDCDLSGSATCIQNQGVGTTVRYCRIHDATRGILCNNASNTTIQYNVFTTFADAGSPDTAHAIDNQHNIGPTLIDNNDILGSNYTTDAIGNYQSSRIRMTNNYFNIQIDWWAAAPFTIGDGLEVTNRGFDNYVANNEVHSTGGVMPGVFGSDGNTIIEKNCFTSGFQAWAYPNENPGNFIGVTIRNNVINMANSYFPVTSIIGEYNTNIAGTDCTLVPA